MSSHHPMQSPALGWVSQVAQGLFQLNFENPHRQRFYSLSGQPAAVPNQPHHEHFFLASNWNFPSSPSLSISEKHLALFFLPSHFR